jgi:hypothetical protein
MHARHLLGLVSALTLLAGCLPPRVVSPGQVGPSASILPSGAPTFVPSVVPSGGAYSDPGIQIFGGSLYVAAQDADGKAVANATLKLYGPTLATAQTNAQGQATLGPLAEGSAYRLIVEAPGYATLQLGNIEVKKKTTSSQQPALSRGAEVSGKVVDAKGGAPVAGAVVSDGLNSAQTDATGAYTLKGVAVGAVTLTASKPGYQTASQTMAVGGGAQNVGLSLTGTQKAVYFDGTFAPQELSGKFSTLQGLLRDAGWSVLSAPPDREGVWVVICPNQALTNDQVERLATFAAQGGKVVILGEWGGYGGFNNPATNNLAHALGLHFNPDVVRDPSQSNPQWPSVRNFPPGSPVAAEVKTIQLYEACSLFGLAPVGPLAQSATASYRVQDNAPTGAHALVVGGPCKGGKAIAVGDASAWTDADTDGNGKANVLEADNARFVTQLLAW